MIGGKTVLEHWQVERLPGAHCYEFYATAGVFHALAVAEPGTFYLTDFLVRYFDRLVIEDLKLDTHPTLRDTLFAHYTRLVYLAQTEDSELREKAEKAADQLELQFEYRFTGYGVLETVMNTWQQSKSYGKADQHLLA